MKDIEPPKPVCRKPLIPDPEDYRWVDRLIDCDEHRLAAALINYDKDDYAFTLCEESGWVIAEPLLLAVFYWLASNLEDEYGSDQLIRRMIRLAQQVLSCADILRANIHADKLQDEGWYTPPTLEESIAVCRSADWSSSPAREDAFEPLLAMLRERYDAAWDAYGDSQRGRAATRWRSSEVPGLGLPGET